jgi:hypothetical protein
MTHERFRALIEGALRVWRVEADLAFSQNESRCEIRRGGAQVVVVSTEVQPFGSIWRIQEPERRERVHPSIVPTMQGLREILCPDRAIGRVLFVSEDG